MNQPSFVSANRRHAMAKRGTATNRNSAPKLGKTFPFWSLQNILSSDDSTRSSESTSVYNEDGSSVDDYTDSEYTSSTSSFLSRTTGSAADEESSKEPSASHIYDSQQLKQAKPSSLLSKRRRAEACDSVASSLTGNQDDSVVTAPRLCREAYLTRFRRDRRYREPSLQSIPEGSFQASQGSTISDTLCEPENKNAVDRYADHGEIFVKQLEEISLEESRDDETSSRSISTSVDYQSDVTETTLETQNLFPEDGISVTRSDDPKLETTAPLQRQTKLARLPSWDEKPEVLATNKEATTTSRKRNGRSRPAPLLSPGKKREAGGEFDCNDLTRGSSKSSDLESQRPDRPLNEPSPTGDWQVLTHIKQSLDYTPQRAPAPILKQGISIHRQNGIPVAEWSGTKIQRNVSPDEKTGSARRPRKPRKITSLLMPSGKKRRGEGWTSRKESKREVANDAEKPKPFVVLEETVSKGERNLIRDIKKSVKSTPNKVPNPILKQRGPVSHQNGVPVDELDETASLMEIAMVSHSFSFEANTTSEPKPVAMPASKSNESKSARSSKSRFAKFFSRRGKKSKKERKQSVDRSESECASLPSVRTDQSTLTGTTVKTGNRTKSKPTSEATDSSLAPVVETREVSDKTATTVSTQSQLLEVANDFLLATASFNSDSLCTSDPDSTVSCPAKNVNRSLQSNKSSDQAKVSPKAHAATQEERPRQEEALTPNIQPTEGAQTVTRSQSELRRMVRNFKAKQLMESSGGGWDVKEEKRMLKAMDVAVKSRLGAIATMENRSQHIEDKKAQGSALEDKSKYNDCGLFSTFPDLWSFIHLRGSSSNNE